MREEGQSLNLWVFRRTTSWKRDGRAQKHLAKTIIHVREELQVMTADGVVAVIPIVPKLL